MKILWETFGSPLFCITKNLPPRGVGEKIYSNFFNRPTTLLGVEEEVEYKTKWTSGKAQYVERNQAMIDESDVCIFYYDEKYQPPLRKQSRRALNDYQPKSGTRVAYEYAKRKKKDVINLLE